MYLRFIVSVWFKFFFILTPFFGLSMFLTLTQGYTKAEQRRLAQRAMVAATVICLSLFFFGTAVFAILGITLDAFRVGAGTLLFLTAFSMINSFPAPSSSDPDLDIAVVPLAMPIIVGPGTVGTLLVLGAEAEGPLFKALGAFALLVALAIFGALLLSATAIERLMGRRSLNTLSKVTALVLAALAAQMIMTGIAHFFSIGGEG